MLCAADGIALDAVLLAAFAAMKWQSDPLFLFVRIFLPRNPAREGAHYDH